MKNKKTVIALISSIVLIVTIAIIAIVTMIIMKNNKKYTITFDTQGGNKIEAIEVKVNETLVLPKNPEKEGYIFLHWVDEEDKPVSNNFKVTKDMKLIAKWAEPTQELITISFDTDGGSKIEDIVLIKGEPLKLPENPIKNGYTFKNWVSKDEIPVYDDALLSEDIVLKAIWEKEEREEKEEKEEKKNEQATTTNKNDKTSQTPSQENQNEQPTPIPTPTPENQNVEVTDISLNKNSLGLIIGNSDTLTANITPSNATNKSVTWSSSNSSIISVDNSGKVTAKAIGSATITAKTANGKTATATVYSDVEKITISVSNSYISKYGTVKSTSLKVTTTPSIDLDDSMYKWYAPDASGSNATAEISISGDSATITARDNWSYGLSQIPVTVSVGRKTSNKVIVYVEPQLSLSSSTGGLTIAKNTNVRIYSTVDGTSWSFNSTDYAENINKQSKLVSFITKNIRTYPQGFQLTGKTNAGQTKTISITVNP